MLVTTGVNIALALLGMVIATIILGSCLEENKKADTPSARHFTALVCCLVGTLLLDAIGWTCHGLAKWSMLRTVTRTLVDIGGYRMLILLAQYLKHQLPRYRKFMTNFFPPLDNRRGPFFDQCISGNGAYGQIMDAVRQQLIDFFVSRIVNERFYYFLNNGIKIQV